MRFDSFLYGAFGYGVAGGYGGRDSFGDGSGIADCFGSEAGESEFYNAGIDSDSDSTPNSTSKADHVGTEDCTCVSYPEDDDRWGNEYFNPEQHYPDNIKRHY